MLDNTLTPKQARFLAAYFETGNASAAYRDAYGASHKDARYLGKKGWQMLRHPLIAPRIAEARARLEEKTAAAAERWGVTAEELSRIVFSYSVTFWLGLFLLGWLWLIVTR